MVVVVTVPGEGMRGATAPATAAALVTREAAKTGETPEKVPKKLLAKKIGETEEEAPPVPEIHVKTTTGAATLKTAEALQTRENNNNSSSRAGTKTADRGAGRTAGAKEGACRI